MLWAAGDIVENRPALSRWHPDYAEAFAEVCEGQLRCTLHPLLSNTSYPAKAWYPVRRGLPIYS